MLQLGRPAGAPRKELPQHLVDRDFRIDATRIDRKAGALGGKTLLGFRSSLLMPDQVHQVCGILAVVDRKGGIETDPLGIFPQQPRADAVKRAGPVQRVGHDPGIVAEHFAGDAFDARGHFGGRPARECHQEDPPRIRAMDDQMRDAVGEGVGLARSGAGDDEKRRSCRGIRSHAMLDRAPLFGIEA